MRGIQRVWGAVGRCSVEEPRWLMVLVLVLGFVRFPSCAPGQAAPQPAAVAKRDGKQYKIAGQVTNSITGEPIARATLILLTGQPRQMVQTVATDANGQFDMGTLPAGKYSLRASRRGYMTSYFDEHEQYSSAIVTGEDQDTEHIPFHMNPSSVIRGVVTDDAGEPVSQAEVLLMRRTKNGGLGEHLVQSIQNTTDDTGLFEFWNLVPGTYFLAVKADPWYALHPTESEQREISNDQQREAMKSLDVAFQVTYFGDVLDESAAQPISITSGDHVQADVVLHAVPAVHMTVPASVSVANQDGFAARPSLTQTVFGVQLSSVFPEMESGSPGGGLMEFSGIAPGHYSVSQGTPPRVTEVDAMGSQQVDLSTGVPTFGVDMKIEMADGSAPPQSLQIVLASENPVLRQIIGSVTDKQDVHFESVPAGKWNALVSSKGVSLAVVLLQTGTVAVADSRFVVKDRRLTMTAELAQGKTGIEGLAKKDGKGEAGIMVVLVPRNPGANLDEFRRDQSDSDGSFLLRDVVPGEYTIVAIEDGWGLDWARPGVISHYVGDGTPVTVQANPGASLRLSSQVLVQAR
jgi:uncharacterized surface anchored protein